MPIRLFFLIRSLEYGGAERQLIELVRGLDKRQFSVTVAAFYDGGALRREIEDVDGIRVISLGKRGRWDVWPFLRRLLRAVREVRPQIVHGYLGIANELGLLAGKVVGAKVVWGLRTSNMDFSRYDWLSAWSFRIAARLSRFTDLIIINSQAGKRHHVANGYCERMVVIPNGIDTSRYRPDREAGLRMRAQWGIAADELLIGLVGRLDPVKDHPTFLRAAALLTDACPNIRFVCVGDGPEPYKRELHELGDSLNLGQRLIWAGAWEDMTAAYNALDILAFSSAYGEGFPNVIGEAMACGVPCVATDMGDSALILAKTGIVVPAHNPAAQAAAWQRVLALSPAEREAVGAEARKRITDQFSRRHMISKTEALLKQLTDRAGPEGTGRLALEQRQQLLSAGDHEPSFSSQV